MIMFVFSPLRPIMLMHGNPDKLNAEAAQRPVLPGCGRSPRTLC